MVRSAETVLRIAHASRVGSPDLHSKRWSGRRLRLGPPGFGMVNHHRNAWGFRPGSEQAGQTAPTGRLQNGVSAKDALVCGATGGRIYGAVGSIGRRSLPRSRADPETAQKPWDPKRWGPGRADAWCLTAEAGWLGSSKHGDLESRIV